MDNRHSFLGPAVLTLAGVIVGGLIAGGFTLWNAERDRDIAASDSRRQAVRLVVVEIGEISRQLQAPQGIAKWDTQFIRRSWPSAMPNEAWRSYGPTLDQARNGFIAYAVTAPAPLVLPHAPCASAATTAQVRQAGRTSS